MTVIRKINQIAGMKFISILCLIIFPLIIIRCSSSQQRGKEYKRRALGIYPKRENVQSKNEHKSTTQNYGQLVSINSLLTSNLSRVEYEKTIVVKGYCTLSFECSIIIPCDSTKPFWIEGNEDFYKIHRSIMRKMGIEKLPGGSKYNPNKVFSILEGEISKKGRYGHMGSCDYQFKVKNVMRMRETRKNDCDFE